MALRRERLFVPSGFSVPGSIRMIEDGTAVILGQGLRQVQAEGDRPARRLSEASIMAGLRRPINPISTGRPYIGPAASGQAVKFVH
jgi:hypothetical protein